MSRNGTRSERWNAAGAAGMSSISDENQCGTISPGQSAYSSKGPAAELPPSAAGQHVDSGEAVASSCGDGEGHVGQTAWSSPDRCSGCAELLHELSNAVTGVLLNAQVLQWKLPPYSHLKRPVREMERNAQRGSELRRRLGERCAARDGGTAKPQAASAGGLHLCCAQVDASCLQTPAPAQSFPDLTCDCDPRTSSFFPKRDDDSVR
ncbi:MAG TPA: hypothetical protein VL240_14465 [Candidatus Binatia bacterium]|nr:hypothetical protein [Candidatus Binatia bacterium]